MAVAVRLLIVALFTNHSLFTSLSLPSVASATCASTITGAQQAVVSSIYSQMLDERPAVDRLARLELRQG